MKFPAVFVNHGAGPLPLMGKQPAIAAHLKDVRQNWLPREKPTAIVMLSGHWEGNPIKISSSKAPPMYFDYNGFPSEAYTYRYPAPGSPALAEKIQNLLGTYGMDSVMDDKRGFDHGVFVALMLMFPEANIPVVMVSMHSSLSVEKNIQLGKALAPLRDDNILIVGSGSTFHNMAAGFHPTSDYFAAGHSFNEWLKEAITTKNDETSVLDKLQDWSEAPGARICHPREDHFVPLIIVAAVAGGSPGKLIFDHGSDKNMGGGFADLEVSSYLFD